MESVYKIADCVMELKNLDRKQSSTRLFPFSITGVYPEYHYDFHYVDQVIAKEDEIIIYSDDLNIVTQREEDKYPHVYYCGGWNSPIAVSIQKDDSHFEINLLKSSLENELHEYIIPNLLRIQVPLLQHKGFVLHSTYIEINGKAVLFTADSGGGKTTQAELWKKYRDAKIINGDKSIVAYDGTNWNAYSSPVSGSSSYCLNESWPIQAIIVLDKGLNNDIIPLKERAFFPLMRQIVVDAWDEEYYEKIMDVVQELCNDIPIFYYSCTKDEDAVKILEKVIFRE